MGLSSDPTGVNAAANDAAEPKDAPVLPVAAELAKAKQLLEDMRLRFKDTHPNVVRQQRAVADLELKAANESTVMALTPLDKRPRNRIDLRHRQRRLAQLHGDRGDRRRHAFSTSD